jgi:hypothetical protein
MNEQKLPADPTSLVLGIISLVVVLVGCCCGLLAIPTLVMSIIGLVMANKSLREYNANPSNFSPASRSNVFTAKIINIIAIILSAIITLLYMAYFFIYGAFLSTAIMEGYKNKELNDTYYESDEWEEYDESENDWIYEESDSIETDTLKIDSLQIEIIEQSGEN